MRSEMYIFPLAVFQKVVLKQVTVRLVPESGTQKSAPRQGQENSVLKNFKKLTGEVLPDSRRDESGQSRGYAWSSAH